MVLITSHKSNRGLRRECSLIVSVSSNGRRYSHPSAPNEQVVTTTRVKDGIYAEQPLPYPLFSVRKETQRHRNRNLYYFFVSRVTRRVFVPKVSYYYAIDDGQRHSAKLAWRALALLQIEIEQEKKS